MTVILFDPNRVGLKSLARFGQCSYCGERSAFLGIQVARRRGGDVEKLYGLCPRHAREVKRRAQRESARTSPAPGGDAMGLAEKR